MFGTKRSIWMFNMAMKRDDRTTGFKFIVIISSSQSLCHFNVNLWSAFIRRHTSLTAALLVHSLSTLNHQALNGTTPRCDT